jgi:hypothetical protein
MGSGPRCQPGEFRNFHNAVPSSDWIKMTVNPAKALALDAQSGALKQAEARGCLPRARPSRPLIPRLPHPRNWSGPWGLFPLPFRNDVKSNSLFSFRNAIPSLFWRGA